MLPSVLVFHSSPVNLTTFSYSVTIVSKANYRERSLDQGLNGPYSLFLLCRLVSIRD